MHSTDIFETAVQRPKPAFLRFASAVGLANLGDGIAVVVWAWTASLLTRDPLWIAALPAALQAPWVLMSLPAGYLTDQVDRRRLIVLCDVVRAVAYAILGSAIFWSLPLGEPPQHGPSNALLYGALLCLGFIIGCAEVTRDNAAQSMLPRVVPQHDLERANGILGSIETVGNGMAGPAIGAALLALFLPAPYALIAIVLLLSAALTGSLSGQFTAHESTTTDGSWKAGTFDAIRFVLHHRMLRTLILVSGTWNFFTQIGLIALVLHVQENLESGATIYGLILAVGAVGGIFGGALVAPALRRVAKGVMARWMGLATAPVFLLIAFAPGPATVAAAMFIFSLSGVIWNAVAISYRQRVVPDEMRGRVNGFYRLFASGTMPLGLLTSGLLVNAAEDVMGRSQALILPFLVTAAGTLILSIVTWRQLGRGFET